MVATLNDTLSYWEVAKRQNLKSSHHNNKHLPRVCGDKRSLELLWQSFTLSTNIELLRCTPETNMFYVNYASIKNCGIAKQWTTTHPGKGMNYWYTRHVSLQRNHDEWKKPDKTEHVWYDSIHIKAEHEKSNPQRMTAARHLPEEGRGHARVCRGQQESGGSDLLVVMSSPRVRTPSQPTTLYTSRMCSLLYANYASVSW